MWQDGAPVEPTPEASRGGTMAARVLSAHGGEKIKFDALISHDITYVGVIQTAMASGLRQFPVPYVLTNCHNSLCAVGGTINADDHVFGLSAARRFGGEYVPANLAVIHQYAREELAGCGKMILGSLKGLYSMIFLPMTWTTSACVRSAMISPISLGSSRQFFKTAILINSLA